MKTIQFLVAISLITFGLFACDNNTNEQTTDKPDNTEDTTSVDNEDGTNGIAPQPNEEDTKSNNEDLQQALQAISTNIEAAKVMYDENNPKNLADCSGIFHRMIDSVQTRFPALGEDDFPAVNVARGSKQIVKWYHDNGNLTIVDDAVTVRNDIEPGTVVFFASKQDPSQKLTIEKLQKIVYHIAIVTSVEKDDNGDLVSYKMMHGRTTGKIASRTESVSIGGEKGRPPLGNSYSQLVAIADLVSVNADLAEAVDRSKEVEAEPVNPIDESKEIEVKPVNPVVDPTYEKYTAGLSEARMSLALEAIAQSIEGQKLKYDRTIGQDCSGIYHRIKDSIQVRFPALARDYQFPQFGTDRNTRQIAHWYHENGNLHFVQDPLAEQNRLRPGSVLFFGRTDEKYDNVDIDLLSNANVFQHDAAAGKGKIYHIAVVTAVRDDNGKKRVTIMHGRNSKHTASRTEVNYDGPGGFKKKFAKFPFGNWNQQLVAIANIATPK